MPHEGLPEGVRDPTAPSSETIPTATVTPDLAAPEVALVPIFPQVTDKTRIVLYAGAPGEIRAHWNLRANDVASYGAGFPIDGGDPAAVLRLHRLGQDGSLERTREIRLRMSGVGGSGDAGFGVGGDGAKFEAELGLMNAGGGWLLLARSNRIQHAESIGLGCLERETGGASWRAHTGAPTGDISAPFAGMHSDVAVGSDARERAADAPPIWTETPPSRDGIADAGIGREHAPVTAVLGALDRGWEDPRVNPFPSRDIAASAGAVSDQSGILAASRIPTLRYGQPASSGTELVIEAELRIHGWATPNTVIDLFGHLYPVGPGGRFQFVLTVDDPDLLRSALARHPPPELKRQRND